MPHSYKITIRDNTGTTSKGLYKSTFTRLILDKFTHGQH